MQGYIKYFKNTQNTSTYKFATNSLNDVILPIYNVNHPN